MPPIFNTSAPKCFVCEKSVYHAEQVLCLGKIFHKPCLKCTTCEKRVDLGAVVDHDSLPYCKICHSRNFGTRGYGGGGALVGTYTSPTSKSTSTSNSPAPSVNANSTPVTPQSMNTGNTRTSLGSPLSPTLINRSIPLQPSTSTSSLSTNPINPTTSPFSSPTTLNYNSNLCPKCNQTVYFAEKILAVGRNWHKSCLRCEICSTSLTSGGLNERGGKPYCKNCYLGQFGNQSPGVMRRAGI